MFGSAILEVAIGVIFVFLLVSVICTAIREGVESVLKTRAAFLEHGIREMLHDRGAVGITRTFYNHPLINSLFADNYVPRSGTERPSALAAGGKLPTYIPTRNFALALMDIAARGAPGAPGSSDGSSPVLSLASVRANVMNLENAPVQRVLLTAIDTAQGDIDKAVANLAAWYDSGMDRVSGAYKRATQKLLFFIGLFVAIVLNVNPLTISNYLYRNDSARAAVVARAEAAAKDSTYVNGTKRYAAARAELDSLSIPMGWAGVHFWWSGPDSTVGKTPTIAPRNPWDDIASPMIGWIITAMAATLGAPFWFDVLNKVMVVRSTVKPHEKSPEESSEDRQTSASKAMIAKGDVGSGSPAVGAAVDSGGGGGGGTGGGTGGGATSSGGPRVQPVATAEAPSDPEADVDGCDVDVDVNDLTRDDLLPAAKGGVA